MPDVTWIDKQHENIMTRHQWWRVVRPRNKRDVKSRERRNTVPPKGHFKNKCYSNWKEKREWLHSVRADLVLNRQTFGLAYVLKHYGISYRIYKEHVDSYLRDAGQPDRKVQKTHRKKPVRKNKN